MTARARNPASPPRIVAPFTVLVDSREQQAYDFLNIHANADQHNALIHVPTMRAALPNGDYSVLGYPQVCVERKSLADLYSSVARRANFESRLARMSELVTGPSAGYAAVIVEADRLACISCPLKFSKLNPRSLSRTLIAWDQRYAVRWHFIAGREAAEVLVYRILERFWMDRQRTNNATGGHS